MVGRLVVRDVIMDWWSDKWFVISSESTRHAWMMSSSCSLTHTKSIMVPLVVEDPKPNVGMPVGERKRKLHLVISSIMLSASLL